MYFVNKLKSEFSRGLSRLRPLSTLTQRVFLNVEVKCNALLRGRFSKLLIRFYSRHLRYDQTDSTQKLYLRARIHPYPGLGHQVSVWLSGFLWARDLGIDYIGGDITHNPDGLLHFSNGALEREANPGDSQRVAHVMLPPTGDERSSESLKMLRAAVKRGCRRNQHAEVVLFTTALDNPRYNQVPAEPEVRRALLEGPCGKRIVERECDGEIRIVIHIRRGDVGATSTGRGSGISRWVAEDWYVEVVKNLRKIAGLGGVQVVVVSLGRVDDFPALASLPGVQLRLNGAIEDDIVELASADILVTAPSSFSFTAALASRGRVLAPYPWWHEVPNAGRWFRVDDSGKFDSDRLERSLSNWSAEQKTPQ